MADATSRHTDLVFDSDDPEAVGQFLDESYGTALRLEHDPGRFTLERTALGLLSVDAMTLGGQVSFDTDPVAMFTVLECRGGHGTFHRDGLTDDLTRGGVIATAPPGHGYRGSCGDLDLRLLNLDLTVLQDVAAEAQGDDEVLRFRQLRTLRRRDAQLWTRLVDFVSLTSAPDRTHVGSLAETHLARLVARTVLDLFPNSTWDEPSSTVVRRDARDASAATVRRATAFIDSSADTELSLADIAGAAHASPRALQAGFRRHLDTTPMGYLQHARLQLARRDLVDAEEDLTVALVASRWGFSNHGRFAATYRSEFGELPSATLARATEAGHPIEETGRVEREDVGGVDDDRSAPLLQLDGRRED